MDTSHLIQNATVISVDKNIGTVEYCDILVRNGVIEQVAPHLSAPEGINSIDATNCIVCPGFIDAHHHLWQQLLRSVATDWSLADYGLIMRRVYGSLFTPADVYAANYTAALDLIHNGITTVIDHCHILNSPAHTDAAISALKDASIRGCFCYGFYANPVRDDLKDADTATATPPGFDLQARQHDAKRAREQHFPVNDPSQVLLTFGTAPDEAESISHEALRDEIVFARSLGARTITAHVALGTYDAGRHVVQKLGDAGLLGPDLLFSHGSSFSDEELELCRKNDSGIVATPETDLQMGMGHPVAFRAKDHGCHRVGIGIDITSNNSNDILAQARLLLQAERSLNNEAIGGRGRIPTKIPRKTEDALYFATLGGAKAIGLDHLVGSITPGKRADLLIIRCDDINVVPVINPIGVLIFNACPANIDTVMVNGAILKRNGKLTVGKGWSDELRQEVRDRTARLVKVASQAKRGDDAAWKSLIGHSETEIASAKGQKL